ncbi:ABC transporter ATP-binding protein [Natronoarchaeum rubrum]|uniref:ABC transporter ATP-binding protein n=1 Tax=Natronoarchaeum rubrum TaxID=755311 RepID=UPI0021138EA0|nr:ABC transporter ATP-binding protein [Natronoarchaeum rubrum]
MATQGTHRSRTTAEKRDADERERKAQGDIALSIESVSKSFGTELAVDELSLSVRQGELLTLLGPSGCGKTTTLRLVAGLERPDAGRIALGGREVSGEEAFVAPEDRDVGVVFQGFALFPHLTAAENVEFGLDDYDAEAKDARVEELLELVGLADQGDAYPNELSGGQQQRIALARSLAPEPEILLLDEPFSNLDVDLRVEMREEVRRILKETGVTAVSVTHDQEEALSISDRVAVMHDGRIEQVGRPEAVFQRPTSRFVAGFLGHASFLSGSVDGDDVETPIATIDRDRIYGFAPEYDDAEIDVLVRPDDLLAVSADEDDADGRITYRRYLGPSVLYRVELDTGDTIECMHNHSETLDLDARVSVTLTADHELAWFPADAASR